MDEHPCEILVELGAEASGRLDKALARAIPEAHALSRSRLTVLIRDGHVTGPGGDRVTEPSAEVEPGGTYRLDLPEPEASEIAPEAIPLEIIHEDQDLIVVNKAAGMVVHPAPGARSGTLVNAVLHHAKGALSGVGGVRRPGIVHRIDKDTSGLLVVAKTDAAHRGLARQFADHSITRAYDALTWGVPDPGHARLRGLRGVSIENKGIIKIVTQIGRHKSDRKKMAVLPSGGRHAVTRLQLGTAYGDLAACVTCRLETGRTHQIRVHAAFLGHPLIGDPVYGRSRAVPRSVPDEISSKIKGFARQALHAKSLGFAHPISGEPLHFEAPMPSDMQDLEAALLTAARSRDA